MISFAEKYPELVKEWGDQNGALQPSQISYGSNKKVWWRGACGHEWYASVKNRGRGHGCPFCSGNRVLPGFNDFASIKPELVKEWSPLNFHKPHEYASKSNCKVGWICKDCGYIWRARIADRTEGHGCPCCAGETIEPGINDLVKLYPEIAHEWSEKNEPVKAEEIYPLAEKRYWWKCSVCGYEWMVQVRRRVIGRGKCPACEARKRKLKARFHKLEKEFETVRPVETILYYIRKAGIAVAIDDEEEIGLKLPIFLPELRVAISFEDYKTIMRYQYYEEFIKGELCKNAGIRLIRVIRDSAISYSNCVCIHIGRYWVSFDEALSAAFEMIGLDVDVDSKKDRAAIFDEFLRIH